MESHDATRPLDAGASNRLLATYLRDHFAGSTAGLALIRRCRRNNAGGPLDDTLGPIETQIIEDRQALLEIMSSLEVAPSSLKSALGSMAEMVGRLKTNGQIVKYSASSRVVELEVRPRALPPSATCGERCAPRRLTIGRYTAITSTP
jgi:hypothetical protein